MFIYLIIISLLAIAAISFNLPAKRVSVIAATLNLIIGVALCFFNDLAASPANLSLFSSLVGDSDSTLMTFAITPSNIGLIILTLLVTLAVFVLPYISEAQAKFQMICSWLISLGCLLAFASQDIISFYAFHELALIPTFLMLGRYGKRAKSSTAWKMMIYLVFGSLILLAGILLLVIKAQAATFTSLAISVSENPLALSDQVWIAGLLLLGFGTLVSLFPFHSWAPHTYANSPTATSMLHAGVLKKFGLIGLWQIGITFVPQGMTYWAPTLCVLLLGNIIFIGFVTINQRKIDDMLAHSSVMHMGYLFLALVVLIYNPDSQLAYNGFMILMLAHGLSTALLFGLSDVIKQKTGSFYLEDLGGLAKFTPKLCLLFAIATMAALGLPSLGNFTGEFLIFFSAFDTLKSSGEWTVLTTTALIAIWGIVISATYGLRAFKAIFQGSSHAYLTKYADKHSIKDISFRVWLVSVLLIITLFILGINPQLFIQHFAH